MTRFASTLISTAGLVLGLSSTTAQVNPFGPPLPEEIAGIFVPPTRSDEPYAATPHAVYRFDPTLNNWTPIYSSTQSQSIIQSISGYAKSSKVLYLAHSKGAAVTSDEGLSWQECDLPDFPANPGHCLSVSVHPADRKEAVLAWPNGAWITRNYGVAFEKLDIPADSYPIQAAQFIGGDDATLVLRTASHLLLQTPGAESWIRIPSPETTSTGFAYSMDPALVILPAPSACTLVDINHPGMTGPQPCPPNFTPECFVSDGSNPGLLWDVQKNQVSLTCIGTDPGSFPLYQSKDNIENLSPHPRMEGALYWTEDTQVMLLTNAFSLAPLTNHPAIDLASLSMGPMEILSQTSTTSLQSSETDPESIIKEVLQTQPPLSLVMESAIKHSDFNPNELAAWKKKVRTRNLLPTFRVGGGAREFPYDQTTIVSETDRYGITTQNDLRLSDAVRNYGYVSAFVEWDLGKLVYDPEQVDISKEKRYSSKARNDLIKMVNGLYFEHIDTLVKYRLHQKRMSSDDKVTALIKIKQGSTLLNSLCGAELFSN